VDDIKDDTKFEIFEDMLKHELFKKDHNLGQKLVIFSESMDTVNYLAARLNRKDVLTISAKNRDKLYKTIMENFDAKSEVRKDEYNIIITTDVLAEGVNLHRSNIVINYDTPWNSTKLMQRIGRVNRIGSESKEIYNYVFYPSRRGNQIIKLNQIALSKIQTFHSTFGEDNQIYSREEIIDRNLDKLFTEGVKAEKADFNEEIPFYEELCSLYQNNRREYNRIAKISLRSRTGREAKEVEGVVLSQDTLVFLKTNVRKCFYRASNTSVEELSMIDALKYFKSAPEEPKVNRIDEHHDHVQKALAAFKGQRAQEHVAEEVQIAQATSTLGAQVNIATNLINLFLPEIQDQLLYSQVVQLRVLAERGVITSIASRLQRMQKELQRGTLKRDEALAQIIDLAKKYNAYYLNEEELSKEIETEAQIILSESFK